MELRKMSKIYIIKEIERLNNLLIENKNNKIILSKIEIENNIYLIKELNKLI
jgi:hypothetical protein